MPTHKLPEWLAEIEQCLDVAAGITLYEGNLRALLKLAKAQHEALGMVSLVHGRPETYAKLDRARRLWEGGGE